mgnify:CR=1 FL=1
MFSIYFYSDQKFGNFEEEITCENNEALNKVSAASEIIPPNIGLRPKKK